MGKKESLRQFLAVLSRGEFDDSFDDVAGVLVAGESDEVFEEGLLDEGLVLLRVGHDVLHHVVPVLALRQLHAYRQQSVKHLLLADSHSQQLSGFRLSFCAFQSVKLVFPVEDVLVELFEVLLDDSAAVSVERQFLVLSEG